MVTDLPCLLYSYSSDPDNTFKAALTEPVTCIGRLGPGDLDPPDAGLVQLSELATVSLRHARIIRTQQGYELHNWEGRYGIGLYEHDLERDQPYLLKHCDVFRIPNLETHVRCQFLEAQSKTQVYPLRVEASRGKVYVFSMPVKLTPNEYRLVAYLAQRPEVLCRYDELIAAVWAHDPQPFERKDDLEVLLSDVRRKLRAASGGVSFLQTVRGQGVRLVA